MRELPLALLLGQQPAPPPAASLAGFPGLKRGAVVGVINDIEVPHGVTSSPDGMRLYFTNEALNTLDVVDAQTLAVTTRIPLSGR